MLYMVSDDASGESLPTRWGLWDQTDAQWDGPDAGLIAGPRELLEARAHQAAENEDDAPSVFH